ncbi:putative tRNA (cytidine(34)-2'-O)-methyltransferase [Philodulcilactobacillus myokoensis]|uniref:Putative tRNA (cytidine(34)-2'-O)-methyltransferase n=1 Tax=Philodulcilactobacillus myokoensis TaxID=2929573 RepID=A0A9W6ESQ4_9LACO|nr:tRNA (cytidine(34)-2'-O)-methyltransferase [Philodulcilactobacillus myokoensis]GLB47030.1 putative tRNA (cytidine(34)-2'-O)-methyltransferase [Philodulcilactobacillus myokoensis]
MTNHIVLFEPLMPSNTGNIARTCAGTDTVLDLIKPLGFSVDDKHLKRAGLDYWNKVNIHYHDNLPAFMKSMKPKSKLFLVSKFAEKDYTENNYSNHIDGDYYFMFGKETTGLPEPFMRKNQEKAIRIPQDDTHIRALNLSNSCAIVIFEVLRQQNFNDLERVHRYPHDKLKDKF